MLQYAAGAIGMAVVVLVINCGAPYCTLKAKAERVSPKPSGAISARDSAKRRLYGSPMLCMRLSTRPINAHRCLIL